MASLIRRLVKFNTFDPLLSTREEVHAFLRTQPDGTAHVLNGSLIVWTNQAFQDISVANLDANFFLNKVCTLVLDVFLCTDDSTFFLFSTF